MNLDDYQKQVHDWCCEAFGEYAANDQIERQHRFLEEALELAQSLGTSHEEALALVDYVYGRPIGEPSQEVGGVMVTLAALCQPIKISIDESMTTELNRINQPEIIEKIRKKQAAKPANSPLPGPTE